MKPMLVVVFFFLLVRTAAGEDMDLRARAEQIMNRALLASRLATPLNIRTEVSYSASGEDGIAKRGSYVRVRGTDGALREEFELGDYRMARIQDHGQFATHGHWVDIPYPVRKVMEFVPYLPIRFEPADVITGIDETKRNGQAAVCIQFVTVRGEDHNPGDVCVAKADGTVMEWHDRDHAFQALSYENVQGALLPSHFVYGEGDKLAIDATVRWTMLDARPDEAFAAPEDWQHMHSCTTFAMPAPKSTPQPAAKGGVDAPVLTVEVRLHVRPDGTVSHAEVLKPVRGDLDAEALELVKTWTYQPGACEGTKQFFALDAEVRFQGR